MKPFPADTLTVWLHRCYFLPRCPALLVRSWICCKFFKVGRTNAIVFNLHCCCSASTYVVCILFFFNSWFSTTILPSTAPASSKPLCWNGIADCV
jgi:hypothetical protein